MPVRDYYQILNVEPTVDEEALKRAFRRMAQLYHPDRCPDDPGVQQRYLELKEAYEVLSDPERRRAYDRRHSDTLLQELALAGGFGHNGDSADPRRSPGGDIEASVTLDFDQALLGGYTHVEGPDGELVRVTIPRGCRDGTAVRVRRVAEGNGQHQDLLVTFRVRAHERFRRDGNHLHVIEKISAVEAMLGTTRSIESPYGRVIRLTIPAGMQPGERLRLRGQGVVTARGTGDLFVEVDVHVPRELTDDQREQLRKAAESLGLL